MQYDAHSDPDSPCTLKLTEHIIATLVSHTGMKLIYKNFFRLADTACHCCCILFCENVLLEAFVLRYQDGGGNTLEENPSVFCLIQH